MPNELVCGINGKYVPCPIESGLPVADVSNALIRPRPVIIAIVSEKETNSRFSFERCIVWPVVHVNKLMPCLCSQIRIQWERFMEILVGVDVWVTNDLVFSLDDSRWGLVSWKEDGIDRKAWADRCRDFLLFLFRLSLPFVSVVTIVLVGVTILFRYVTMTEGKVSCNLSSYLCQVINRTVASFLAVRTFNRRLCLADVALQGLCCGTTDLLVRRHGWWKVKGKRLSTFLGLCRNYIDWITRNRN